MIEPEDISGEVLRLPRAACKGVPGLFFSSEGEKPTEAKEKAQKAKTVCAGCEHKDECLEWALKTGQRLGVWGGEDFTHEERGRIYRRWLRAQGDAAS